MKRPVTYAVVAALTFLTGIMLLRIFQTNQPLARPVVQPVVQPAIQPAVGPVVQTDSGHTGTKQFRLTSGGPRGSTENYIFLASDGEKVGAINCQGCLNEGEIVMLYHDFTSQEQTCYLLQANLKSAPPMERGSKLDEHGRVIGERGVVVRDTGGGGIRARIYWTEGKDFWFIETYSLDLAREFESSEAFRSFKTNNLLNR